MRVSVHRNLTWMEGKGFSILDSTMRVTDRKLYVLLSDCTFVVHPSGKARAVETGVRNVHAFVRGELIYSSNDRRGFNLPDTADVVNYNPFNNMGFTVDDKEVWSADRVWFCDGRAYVR